jgi:hypothetical protein
MLIMQALVSPSSLCKPLFRRHPEHIYECLVSTMGLHVVEESIVLVRSRIVQSSVSAVILMIHVAVGLQHIVIGLCYVCLCTERHTGMRSNCWRTLRDCKEHRCCTVQCPHMFFRYKHAWMHANMHTACSLHKAPMHSRTRADAHNTHTQVQHTWRILEPYYSQHLTWLAGHTKCFAFALAGQKTKQSNLPVRSRLRLCYISPKRLILNGKSGSHSVLPVQLKRKALSNVT